MFSYLTPIPVKRISTSFALLFLTTIAFTQSKSALESYNKGKEYYDDSKYANAIPGFRKAVLLSSDYQDAIYHLGLCYAYTKKFDEALEQFKELEKLNPDYYAWYHYEAGKSFLALGKYDESINAFTKFQNKFPNSSTNTKYHHQAQFMLSYVMGRKELLKQGNTMSDPVKFPYFVNSAEFSDYAPSTDPTGRIIYFSSKRKGGFAPDKNEDKEGDDDLYKVEFVDGKWSSPQLLPEPINSPNNEGSACVSADGQMLVYVACSREDGVGSCDLYVMTLEGDKWSAPKNMGNVVNSKQWDSNPTISSDGQRIIFASQREGGYGSSDLYMIEKNSFGEWGTPMNLGGVVNTPFADNYPYLSSDGKTLYMASQGHPGYGEYDLFKTVFENGKWTQPVNMGKPLNTAQNDIYFSIGGSGETAYFASSINQANDAEELYSITIPEAMRPTPTVIVSGVVSNAKTGDKVGAYVLVEDLNSGELIAINKSNSLTGKYLVVLPAGRNYSVSANKEAFFFFSQSFDLPATAKYQEIKKDISLKPIEKGAKVVLNNIFFETGKATLSPDSKLELTKCSDLMKANPSMIIEVGGHTDNVGDDALNMKLSGERAKSVREHLIADGIVASRIQSKGYGESSPVASNDMDDGRKANRRTEFIILEF